MVRVAALRVFVAADGRWTCAGGATRRRVWLDDKAVSSCSFVARVLHSILAGSWLNAD